MGEIIDVTTGTDELPAPLTETEVSGFQPGEYLAEGPAIDAVADDETVRFVLTNRKQGITIAGRTTEHVIPDKRYQTVVVVTDRRVVALVGSESGDERFTLDISEIADVTVTMERRTGRLTIDRTDGLTWKLHTEASGLESVANYLRSQSDSPYSGGSTRAATESIRSLFETTVDTAKSFKDDRVAELIPAVDEPSRQADHGPDAVEVSQSEGDEPDTDTSEGCGDIDTETAITKITQALAKTDWRARSSPAESPFDLLAEREDERMGIVVHCPDDGRIDRSALKQCETITGAAGTDTVMLATTGTVRGADARLATELGVRLRNVETLSDATDPPTIEAVREMVSNVLAKSGWSVRTRASGPFDLLADHGNELMGVVVHRPEDGTVESTIEHCSAVTGAAGTDTVMLATTGTVRDEDERLADELGVRLVKSDSLGQRHVTEIERN